MRSIRQTVRRRHGLTLVEVMASIALLGTLLVGIVMAKSRHTHQWSKAQRKLQAVQAADSMLSSWWADARSIPREGEGQIQATQPLRWTTRVIASPHARALRTQVVRLEIFDSELTAGDPQAIASVDLLLPEPPQAATTSEYDENRSTFIPVP